MILELEQKWELINQWETSISIDQPIRDISDLINQWETIISIDNTNSTRICTDPPMINKNLNP